MARITIEYDARSAAAKSIVEMIQKSGLFKVKTSVVSMSKEQVDFSRKLTQGLKEARQMKHNTKHDEVLKI